MKETCRFSLSAICRVQVQSRACHISGRAAGSKWRRCAGCLCPSLLAPLACLTCLPTAQPVLCLRPGREGRVLNYCGVPAPAAEELAAAAARMVGGGIPDGCLQHTPASDAMYLQLPKPS